MIKLDAVSKEFSNAGRALKTLNNLSLDIADGEFVTLFGPNGCGKSTLLNIVAGLDMATSGSVRIHDRAPQDSKVGFVFQNYHESLFPWRTALENVEFALEVQGVPAEKRCKQAERLLKEVGLLQAKDRFLYELSGGMRQLVAICRAFAYEPDLLLMDEPFSALDYSTSKSMELKLLELWAEKKITTLFVSHDIDEAIFLADRVVVLSPRPAQIKKIFFVNLPRPRTLDLLSTGEFVELRREILHVFEYV